MINESKAAPNRGQLRNLAVSALGVNLAPPNDTFKMKVAAITAKLRKPSIRCGQFNLTCTFLIFLN